MTANEASRMTDAAKTLINIVKKRSYSTLVYSPENAEAFTAACALEAATASRPVDKNGYVAVGELEALADMWEGCSRTRDNDYETGVEHGKNRCADDLRNLIKANSNE